MPTPSAATSPSSRRSRVAMGLIAAVVAFGAACDFSVGGASGCARVSQGDYALPTKRILKASVAARLTQRGMDFLSARIRALVLAFFDADADGRAVIPLSRLGIGSLSTSLGPLDGELRDLVLVVDLASLDVRFRAGSSPPRLDIRIEDAVVGLADGALAGTIDAFLFSGDVACALGDGPDGRIARLDLSLSLEIAASSEGALAVRVLPSSVDLHDVALAVDTDCDLAECLDGLAPPSTDECLECETLCPVVDLGSALVSALQSAFDDLVDGLLDLLADDLSNLLLDGLLNGRPLAIEGELDLASLLGPALPWLATARPLGLLARPAGDAFAVTGSGETLGLDVVLDAGLDAAPPHACVGPLGPDPSWEPGLRPSFDGLVAARGGALVPYDFAVGVSDAVVNEALWSAYKAGALCVEVTTDDLAALSAGSLVVTARALDLLLPGVTTLTGPDAPVRIRLQPDLAAEPTPIRFGDGVASPLVALRLPGSRVSVDALVGEQFLRLVSFRADLVAGLAVDLLPDARLGLRLDGVTVSGLDLGDHALFAEARLDLIAPFVVDLALGFLADRPITVELGTSDLLSGFGLPVAPEVLAVGPAGPGADWLGVYVGLSEPATPTAHAVAPLRFGEAAEGAMTFTAGVDQDVAVQLRVAGGSWGPWFEGPGPHRLSHPRLWLVGEWPVEARLRRAGGYPEEGFAAGRVKVAARTGPVPAADSETRGPAAIGATSAPPAAVKGAAGCAAGRGGGGGLAGALGVAFVVWALRRRRRGGAAALLLAAAASAACGEASEAPARPCAHHDECDDDYLCGPAGVCVAAEACDADSGCCPGAVCFNGWCRPTQACGVGALGACEGLGQVCEGGQCVAAPCAGPGECPSGWGCVAGRCVVGAPCGDRCGTGQVCEAGSGRCLPAAPGPSCGPGARAVVAGGLGADPWSCHAYAWPVECAALPEVEAGAPGVDGRAVATGSGPALVSYDPRYGDLVYTRFEGPGGGRRDFVLDGLPPGAFEAGIEGYRWGSPTPGPDRGWRPAVGRERTAEGPLEVLYGDTDTGGVRYGSFEPMAGAALGGGALPIAGRAGRWSCLSWRGVGQTVRLAGLVFIEADERGERSTLVRFEALVESPTAPEHWRVEPVFEVPLPPLDEEPCGGSCGLAAVCVRGLDGLDGCASTAAAGACAAPCGPREVCGRLGAGAATCLSRVYPRYEAERTPFGRGLFVDCARDADGELVAAWYDADARHLEAGRWPFAEGDRAVVDGGGGADRGRQVRIAVSLDGRIGLAYRDEGESALRYAEAASARGPWTVTTVHAPEGADADLGAWPDLRFDAAGAPVVAYGDAVAGGVWVARRDGSGCWARARAFAAGSYAWPGVLDLGDGALSVTARAHAFAPDLSALHAPVWARVPLPACGG